MATDEKSSDGPIFCIHIIKLRGEEENIKAFLKLDTCMLFLFCHKYGQSRQSKKKPVLQGKNLFIFAQSIFLQVHVT